MPGLRLLVGIVLLGALAEARILHSAVGGSVAPVAHVPVANADLDAPCIQKKGVCMDVAECVAPGHTERFLCGGKNPRQCCIGLPHVGSDKEAGDVTKITYMLSGVLKGMGPGLFKELQETKLGPCANMLVGTYDNVKIFAANLKGNVDSMRTAATALKAVLTDFSGVLTKCVDPVAGDRLANLTKHMETELMTFEEGATLAINGINVYSQLQGVVEDYKSGKYIDAGEQLGQALQSLGTAASGVDSPWVKVFEGYAGKLGVAVDDAVKCAKDLGTIQVTVKDLAKGLKADTAQFEQTIHKLGLILTTFDNALTACGVNAALAEVQKASSKSKVLAKAVTAVSVGESIVVEGSQVLQQIEGIITSCGGEQFATCGSDIGALLLKIPETKNVHWRVLVGYVRKLGGTMGQVGRCVADGVGVYDDIKRMGQYEGFTEADIKGMLGELAKILQSFASALSDCGVEDLGGKTAKIAQEIQAGTVTVEAGTKLVLGGINVYDQFNKAIKTCKAAAHESDSFNGWLSCGSAIGTTTVAAGELDAPMLTIFKNFVLTMGNDLLGITQCVGDIESVRTDFETFIAQARTAKTVDEAKTALESLANVLKVFAQALTACHLTWLGEKILGVIAKLQTGVYEVEVGVKIALDGVDLFEDSEHMYEAYEDKNYIATGVNLAKLVGAVINILA